MNYLDISNKLAEIKQLGVRTNGLYIIDQAELDDFVRNMQEQITQSFTAEFSSDVDI